MAIAEREKSMKTINTIELSAILAGLRLLQTHGYPVEYEVEGEMTVDEIDELCESLNCEKFASIPLKEEKLSIWCLIADTDELGSICHMYAAEAEAKQAYIDMVLGYEQVKNDLKAEGIETPNYDEANEAWENNQCGVDTIRLETGDIDVLTKHCVEVDAEYNYSVCPECGSSDISGSHFEADGNTAFQPCHCSDCGAIWDDNYVLTGYDIQAHGNKAKEA